MAETIIIAGALAQRQGYGGHAWFLLQYLLGFRRLGWEVVLLDRLEPGMCHDAAGDPCEPERSVELRYLRDALRPFELDAHFALLYDGGARCIGMSRAALHARVRDAALLLNVMGYCRDAEVLGAARRLVFLDIDPGFGQMWRDLGLCDLFTGHDAFVSVGANIGQPGCAIPECGLRWQTTPPPVVLDYWPRQPLAARPQITSVASWRGPDAPISYRGQTYGLRAHAFRPFADLPRRSGRELELALDIHPSEERDLALLREGGWQLVAPRTVAGDPQSYRAYVQASRAELMIAKQIYALARSGWLSDRSVCYLASGRPVLMLDTGIGDRYPSGRGLITFATPEEALAALDSLDADYAGHASAARELAENCFDSDRVLARLIDMVA